VIDVQNIERCERPTDTLVTWTQPNAPFNVADADVSVRIGHGDAGTTYLLTMMEAPAGDPEWWGVNLSIQRDKVWYTVFDDTLSLDDEDADRGETDREAFFAVVKQILGGAPAFVATQRRLPCRNYIGYPAGPIPRHLVTLDPTEE
jgi:hypothetical protein